MEATDTVRAAWTVSLQMLEEGGGDARRKKVEMIFNHGGLLSCATGPIFDWNALEQTSKNETHTLQTLLLSPQL